jgi:serine/threonine-protein kinase
MGQVWVARNASTGADVAVKVLLPERVASADALERFRREAHATAQLTHRGIVRVFDLLELDPAQGSLIMVMELLRGHTLAEHIYQLRRLSVEQAMDVVLPVLSALTHAHGVGIVHRDLKPENIFLALEPDGQIIPKVLDFGISKCRNPLIDSITADGELVGTPCYMSPEQARGKIGVDARSDVFSMGILLYEMLSGNNPFLNDGIHAVVMAILDDDPAPIEDIPAPVWAVIAQALSKNRDVRYAGAAELASALREALPEYAARYEPRPLASYPSAPPMIAQQATALAPSTRTRRLRAAAGIVAAGALLSMAVVGTIAHGVEARERVDARAVMAPEKAPLQKVAVVARTALATSAIPAAAPPAPPIVAKPIVAAAVTTAPATVTSPPPVRRPRFVLPREPGF